MGGGGGGDSPPGQCSTKKSPTWIGSRKRGKWLGERIGKEILPMCVLIEGDEKMLGFALT